MTLLIIIALVTLGLSAVGILLVRRGEPAKRRNTQKPGKEIRPVPNVVTLSDETIDKLANKIATIIAGALSQTQTTQQAPPLQNTNTQDTPQQNKKPEYVAPEKAYGQSDFGNVKYNVTAEEKEDDNVGADDQIDIIKKLLKGKQ